MPPLHVDGRHLKDDCGNNVVLHGVAITPSPWFNGCMYGFSSQYCTWDNYDVQGALEYNKAVMDKLTNTEDGWYLNYIRLHIDPYWTNTPGDPIPENDISRFDFDRLVRYTDEVIIPLIDHAQERGLYVILRPPGVSPHRIAVNDGYHQYLKVIWTYLSQHKDLKNSDHVMFELANEPVEILGTNGVWGTTSQAHFDALNNFFEPIVDIIRNNGADNILWIPGTGWQSHYQGYAVNPIDGDNIGYAVHIYPGYWGGIRNFQAFQRGWNEHVKPIADIAPIAVTETDWAPEGYGAFGVASTGVEGGEGFGANLNYILDQSGNVSWNVLSPDNLIDHGDPNAGVAYNGDWEASAAPVKQWFREYASENVPDICKLVPYGVYEIEIQQDQQMVLELTDGTHIRPTIRNSSLNQQWMALESESGSWRFISMASKADSSIQLVEGSLETGTTIQLLPDSDDDAGEWQLTELETGNFEVLPAAAIAQGISRVWDLSDCILDGTEALQLNERFENSCQQFRFNFIKNGEHEQPPVTGFKGLRPLPSVKVYPNPSANGAFDVSIPPIGNEKFSISIWTIDGKEVFRTSLSNGENHVNTRLPAGFYILKVQSGRFYKAIKLGIE